MPHRSPSLWLLLLLGGTLGCTPGGECATSADCLGEALCVVGDDGSRSCQTLDAAGGDAGVPPGSIDLPVLLRLADGTEHSLAATLKGDLFELDGESGAISLLLVVEDARTTIRHNNGAGEVGLPGVVLNLTTPEGSWSQDDAVYFSWMPHAENTFDGSFVAPVGAYHTVLVGQLATRVYHCVAPDWTCLDQEVRTFAHEENVPNDCPGEEREWQEGSCANTAVASCDTGNGQLVYLMPGACIDPALVNDFQSGLCPPGGYDVLNGGCP